VPLSRFDVRGFWLTIIALFNASQQQRASGASGQGSSQMQSLQQEAQSRQRGASPSQRMQQFQGSGSRAGGRRRR